MGQLLIPATSYVSTWTYWSCNSLALDTEFKTVDGNDEETQYRNLLRVSIYRHIEGLKNYIGCDNTITEETQINASFNGGDVISIEPGTDFISSFVLVGEDISPLYDNGSEVMMHSKEYVAYSAWTDFSWQDGGTTGNQVVLAYDNINSEDLIESTESRLETRGSPAQGEVEQYRNRYIPTISKVVDNITSIDPIDAGLYSLTDVDAYAAGYGIGTTSPVTHTLVSSDFYDWYRVRYEIIPYGAIGGKLSTIRRTFEAKGDWNELPYQSS